jgi:DNA repair exonuclease SbcCD ATPase subunit
MQAELTAVSKENKKLVEAKNALDRVARERAAATEKIEKNIDVFKGKAAAAAAAAAAADAKTKQSLQVQAEMQAALAEAKKETAAAKADAAAATKKLEALDRKRALGDSEFAVLETEAMDDNPEALKHKYEPQTMNLFTDSTPPKALARTPHDCNHKHGRSAPHAQAAS